MPRPKRGIKISFLPLGMFNFTISGADRSRAARSSTIRPIRAMVIIGWSGMHMFAFTNNGLLSLSHFSGFGLTVVYVPSDL